MPLYYLKIYFLIKNVIKLIEKFPLTLFEFFGIFHFFRKYVSTRSEIIFFKFIFKNNNTLTANYNITFHVRDEMDNLVFEGSTAFSNKTMDKTSHGIYKATCDIPKNLLNEGKYRIGRLFFIKDFVDVLSMWLVEYLCHVLKRKN